MAVIVATERRSPMLLIATKNGAVGMAAGWSILAVGGSALDAVEAATRCVEDDPSDHTVGYGGYPNQLGEVELDASIMDGTTRRTGAVAALKGYRAAISIARKVMEGLPHVLLVGDGAACFAAQTGFAAEDLLTPEAHAAYRKALDGEYPQDHHDLIAAVATLGLDRSSLLPRPSPGTVNFIARDQHGRIASAVSTSGWPWKYPGRVGDSAVIGAGNYADDRFGAAACTGWGELAIRAGTARNVVAGLQHGHDLDDACHAEFRDLSSLGPEIEPFPLQLIAIDADDGHVGYARDADRHYLAWTDGMTAFSRVPCVHVRGSVA
jgi:isoaspartyl peptidase/L-asparaginase-like protein (Ntn-hydrolase superfamily)